ncbi:MAG: ATP-binding protein [Desulfobacterales bacterium]|jgi:two-component system sensor histidine kinase KdpD|nr:ATP-binding protein [Desulfobacterales bacterium]
MDVDNRFSKALMKMVEISNRADLAFNDKLQHILTEVVICFDAAKGSVMINREVEYLEVVASTDSKLIGVRQRISERSPATWVFLNAAPLYMEKGIQGRPMLRNKFQSYQKGAFLIAPIGCGDQVIGVVSVTEKKGADLFSEEEQQIIITFAGQLIGAIEKNQLTEALQERQRELEQRNYELEKLKKLRTELFNMLVHDLKGPISEVVANIDILSYTVQEENMEYVKAAQAGCDTLYRMISDLLDIARLEEGSLNLVREPIRPREMLSEAVSRVHSIARTRSVILQERCLSPLTDETCYGDRGLLVRVLQNFLMNAICHSPENEVVEIGCAIDKNGDIRCDVTDRGPGVAPEFQRAIFDKYFQVQKKNDGRLYATGLGLAFCKMAIDAHKGNIGVVSDGKKGSTFWFTIPGGES